MQRILKRIVLAGVALLVCVAAIRLAIVASRADTGWATVVTSWRSAIPEWLSEKYETIVQREPSEQAEYWLREVDAVLVRSSESAELYLGAACVLDSPGIDFMMKHVKQGPNLTALPMLSVLPDQEAISAAKAQFEAKCAERCLDLAAKACELKPDNQPYWRMRALLQFNPDTNKPRHADWQQVIDQCAAHDPDNALYDYLAAHALWTQSAEYDFDASRPSDAPWILTIHDAEAFQRGIDQFERGLDKSHIAIGEEELSAVARFLQSTSLPMTEQDDVAASRLLNLRYEILFYRLWRWENVRADAALAANDATGAVKVLRQQQRMLEQAALATDTSSLRIVTNVATEMLANLRDQLSKFASDHPEALGEEEFVRFEKWYDSLRFDAAIWTKALQRFHAARRPLREASVLLAVLVWTCCEFVLALVGIATASFIAAALLGSQKTDEISPSVLPQMTIWAIGSGVVLVLFGMAPAEYISRSAQTWILTTLMWCVVAAVAAFLSWIGYRLLRRRYYQFSLLSLFGLMTAVAFLVLIWPELRLLFSGFAAYPPERLLPARGFGTIDGRSLQAGSGIAVGSWLWISLQWWMYSGPWLSVALAMTLIAFWYAWRTSCRSGERFFNYWTSEIRARWATLTRFTAKSAVGAAAVWLIIYLLIAPSVIRDAEDEFQYRMRYVRDAREHMQLVEAAKAEIRASPAEMTAICEPFGGE